LKSGEREKKERKTIQIKYIYSTLYTICIVLGQQSNFIYSNNKKSTDCDHNKADCLDAG
jgi:hypothetical protein